MQGLLILFLLVLTGCGQPPKTDATVAQVNRYVISGDEFRRELAATGTVTKSFPASARLEIQKKTLDNMIVRQLLLEEAQKLELDKDPVFMHEVENYWRQALLKAVLNKKSAEFEATQKITDADIRSVYDRMGTKMELDLVILVDAAAAHELAAAGAAGYEEMITRLGSKVLSRSSAELSSNDFPLDLAAKIWPLAVGAVSPAIYSPEEGWMVVKVLATKPTDVKPLSEMTADVRREILGDRVQDQLDDWIKDLQKKAQIQKYPAVINGIISETSQPTGGHNGK